MIKKLLLTTLLLIFAGCVQPKYDDNWDENIRKPKVIHIKHIIKGTHTDSRYYTYGIDTIYTPANSNWLTQNDLKLMYRKVSNNERSNIRRKSILLHENAHMINGHEWKLIYSLVMNYRMKGKDIR